MTDQRKCDRFRLAMPATARQIGGEAIELELNSLSDIGFAGIGDVPHGCDISVVVQLPVVGDAIARLIWTRERSFAGEFLEPVDSELIVDCFYGV